MYQDRTVRPHWRRFIAGLDAIHPEDLVKRWQAAGRLLHENGLSYTVDSDVRPSGRPWDLDFMPVLLDAAEWRTLERGLIQRARLLNRIAADLYGRQRLLKDGHIPASLVLANPHFLRPAHGISPGDGIFLHLYAVDLSRDAQGRWWVLADRAQAPTGVGYALENRIVLSRCLPELFRECQITRLAGYFQSSHHSLVEMTRRENPRIVVLTAGASSPGYFAQAYVARYLGYSLAEGGDLTVRENRVYLQTVDGLKPVDLIIRRIDGEDCDPLELKGTSSLGIPGLLQAARAGTVVLANALGSGVIETKALMEFLPDLSNKILGEDLAIPSIRTWWCGRQANLEHVLARPDAFVVEPAFRRRSLLSHGPDTVNIAQLCEIDRGELIRRITRRGFDYVAHETVPLSTSPSWVDGRLQPRPMTLRVFLSATADGYVVMPGGLTRVWTSKDGSAPGLHRGERTKDTWVVSEGPVSPITLLRSAFSYAEPKRTGKDLPSRSADNLFWLGRYAERAEDTIRVLRSVIRRLTEDAGPVDNVRAIERVLRVLLERSSLPPWLDGSAGSTDRLERRLSTLMFDPKCAYGLQETLTHLHRTASLVRDRLSHDAWRTLQRFYTETVDRSHHARWFGGSLDKGEAIELLDDTVRALAAFNGMEMENMTRNHGWRFLDMGRRLERAQHLSELLRSVLIHGNPEDDGSLILLLELADSFMTYRSRYLTTPILPPVIDLLLLDETNPRSVGFQMVALAEHVEQLPRDTERSLRNPAQRTMLALLTANRLAEIVPLCDQDGEGRRRQLETLLDEIIEQLPKLSEMITRDYFSHAEARRPADL
jgi:uncharacterized circularly permuted ATP-grasp superfamily protein/uncharacterized alpha-E superfamily protein